LSLLARTIALSLGLTVLVGTLHAQRPGIRYDAVTHDSIELLTIQPQAVPSGDTVYVLAYRTFLPIGDTAGARREAIPWWPVLVAQMRGRVYRAAGIVVLWPRTPSDSLFERGVAEAYRIGFVTDSLGCWHLRDDPTPIQTCDPSSAGRVPRR
jgi:hypothetical protein